jgi:hypothetical protein
MILVKLQVKSMATNQICSDHTPCPKDYLAWHDWAERKSKTHRTIQCPGCGLWAIWVKKTKEINVSIVVETLDN